MVLSIIAEWLLCVETQATKNKEIPIYVLQCITSIEQQFLMARSYNFALGEPRYKKNGKKKVTLSPFGEPPPLNG